MRAPDFWTEDGLLPKVLSPLGALYALGGKVRHATAKPYRAPVPVICVGNLTAGGAGKTPTATAILTMLSEQGIAGHALTRGYGGTERGPHFVEPRTDSPDRVGDEPLLLAAHAPTWVAKDRVAGAKAAAEEGAQAIVMDDGFQNPSLVKDLSIIVVDAAVGLGNGRVIPAGPLREPLSVGLARADAALVIGDGPVPWPNEAFEGKPVFRAKLSPRFSGISLTGARVFAFAGIGRPEKFFETVRRLGAQVIDQQSFPDHHRYSPRMVERLLSRATDQGLVPVTTEKDLVKLPKSTRGVVWPVPVGLTFEKDAEFKQFIRSFVPAGA